MYLRTDYIKSGSITIKDIRITKETIVATQKVKYGSNITDLPTATDKAYTFNGWYTSSVGGEQVTTSTTMPANDVTYYAHWTPITYTLTVNPMVELLMEAQQTELIACNMEKLVELQTQLEMDISLVDGQ